MHLPTISEYALSISNPTGLLRTLGDFEPEKDFYGNVRIRTGNNAAVFKVYHDGKPLMVKCHIKLRPDVRTIYEFLARENDPLLHPTKLMRGELYVFDSFGNGMFHDLVVSEWAEGTTLETAIRRAHREYGRERFVELSRSFDDLAFDLLGKPWAHGDLKPENIVVSDKGRMSLIDYDAMFIPSLGEIQSTEIGTPGYQHPLRNELFPGKHIDDYPLALISVSLAALAIDPELYDRYNKSDNIILYPNEIIEKRSAAYENVLDLLTANGDHLHYALALSLGSEVPSIPSLRRIFLKLKDRSTAPGISAADPVLFGENGLWGYAVERSGEVVIEPIYKDASSFREGLAVVRSRNKVHVIDRAGNSVFKGSFEAIKPFSEGRAAFRKDGKWGYIDTRGNQVVEPIFEMAASFHESKAAVKIRGKWGFAGCNGNLIIEPLYDHACSFRNGTAEVEKGGSTLMIDHSGLPI